MIEGKRSFIKGILIEYNVFLVLVVLMFASMLLSDVFFTWGNLTNILRQYTPLILVSIGMNVAILTGGIDLSVGSTVAVSSVTCAILIVRGFGSLGYLGLILAIVIALASGILAGSITGALVAYFKVPPFVASLAMMSIGRGAAYMITNGEPIRIDTNMKAGQVLAAFGSEKIPLIELPWPILVEIAAVILFFLISKYTVFGRLTIAIGSNESAVHLSGIEVRKYKFMVYIISGLLSALAGIIITARSGVGVPKTGIGLELDALAASVIGGTSLMGGKGRIINTVIGVLVLGLISNTMNIMSVPLYPQQIIKGVIIVVAVLAQGVKKQD